jgi:hypothetical protein
MAKDNTQEEVVVVNEGATYEAKNEDTNGERRRVVAFHVDRPRSTVLFAPLGSGREERLSVDEFLRDFDLLAQQGEPLPEDKEEAQRVARERKSSKTEDTGSSLVTRNEAARRERADAVETARMNDRRGR